jgi:hypothetical protein
MNGTFWDGIENNQRQYDPNQLEIKYFWPLTEQIPLDLDYTNCERPKLYTSSGTTIQGTTGTTWVTAVSNITPSLVVNGDNVEGYMKIGNLHIGQKKPNFFRKVIYKILGFNWEKK